MKFQVVIPARYDSTRLPGKPLLDLGGEPMILRVYQRAIQAGAEGVVIATDDSRIAEVATAAGADVCMTASSHQSGTDRIAEVVATRQWPEDTIVVNLQGDEPLMRPQLLADVAADLDRNSDAAISTLATPLATTDQVFDPNIVKVVLDEAGYALYFSRAPIPWQRDQFDRRDAVTTAPTGMLRHLGLYAYRAGFLSRFTRHEPAPIESAEALEQLRALWLGERIHVMVCPEPPPPGVDTEEDAEAVREILSSGRS